MKKILICLSLMLMAVVALAVPGSGYGTIGGKLVSSQGLGTSFYGSEDGQTPPHVEYPLGSNQQWTRTALGPPAKLVRNGENGSQWVITIYADGSYDIVFTSPWPAPGTSQVVDSGVATHN